MKIITIDSDAYKSLERKIDRIYAYVKEQAERAVEPAPDPAGIWVDNTEAAELLEVSKRTLQRLRSAGEITYSIRGGRVRYRLSDVQGLIAGRVVVSKYRQEADLLRAHQQFQERKAARGKIQRNRKK